MYSKPKACVVLPTYNEAKNVPIIIPAIFEQAGKIDSHDLCVLVVDDNSPDGTQDQVKKMMCKYKNLYLITGEKKGLGEAYKKGFDYAIERLDPDLIFEMDADLQHDPSLIPLFISLTHYGFSMVIGSRFTTGGSTPNFSFKRRLLSLIGNWMIRCIGGLPNIQDCTSGYRCIKAALIKKCDLSFLSTRGYSFQSSLLCELLKHGARVAELPITFPDRQHGKSKLSFRDQCEFLLNIPKIRLRQSSAFIKFCVVGASGVFVNTGIFALLTRILGMKLEFASPIAIVFAILSNFILNDIWTFKFRRIQSSFLQRLMQFYAVCGVAAIVNYSSLLLLVRTFNIWDIGANLIGIMVGTIFNYSMNSLWTWKNAQRDQTVPEAEGLLSIGVHE
jgi:dolichol-phosphate mannosyltransferase